MSIRLICIGGALASLALAGPAIAQTAPAPYLEATRYDLGGRVVGKILPDPDGGGPLRFQASRNTYDSYDNVVRVETGELAAWQSEAVKPEDWTGFTIFSQVDTTYDAMSRKIVERVWAAGVNYAVTQYSYDNMGRLECTAVRMNPAAFASLPASACMQGTQGPFGPDRITRTQYNANGLPILIQKGYGTTLQQNYATYTYENSPGAAPTTVTDANGNKAAFEFGGPFYEITKWSFPDKLSPGHVSSSDYESYGHDANGNRTSLRKRDGRTFTYAYDALNRVTSKIVPDACVSGYVCTNVPASATRDVYYGYDLRGLQTAARFDSASGADAVTSGYDGFGRLTSSTTSMGGVSRTLTYNYSADGNRTRVTHPDGNYFGYHRDGLGRILFGDLNATTQLFHPQYDAAGRPSNLYRLRHSDWTWGMPTVNTYDGVSRLASRYNSFTSAAYSALYGFGYNPAGQITSRTRDNNAYAFTGYVGVNRSYSTNGLNQYSSAGGVSFGYDSNGNLTASGTTAYTYDAENRLVVASTGANLVYDPLGRLYQTSGGIAGTTQFLYDGDELVAEYSGTGSLLRRYVHGSDADDPLVWYEGAGVSAPRYLYSDHQGSIVAVTDHLGNVLHVNTYDEYGIPGSANAGRFQYTGQAWIPELGMYHYKARIYSPTLGRFLQTDPIGYDDQVNLYAYVANDPVNRRDPTGLAGDPDPDSPLGEMISEAKGRLWEGMTSAFRTAGVQVWWTTAEITTLPLVGVEGQAATVTVRAGELAATLAPRTRAAVTIAVTETKEGVRLVSSSEGLLRPATRAALQPGEIAARGARGTHAEVNGVRAARAQGLTPTQTGASRPICQGCRETLRGEGVRPQGPLKGAPAAAPRPGIICRFTGYFCR